MSGNMASECVSCYPRWRPSHVPDPAETQSLRLHRQTTDQTKESVNNITTTSLLVVKKRKWDSITPTIRDNLHWRLVRQRIDFKICILVYKCLHQLVAPYLVSMISPVSTVSTRRHLRSAGQGDLVVPRTRTTCFGPRSFSVAGPLAWNSLPPEIKMTSLTLGQFSGWRKTEMFLRSYYASAQPSSFLL